MLTCTCLKISIISPVKFFLFALPNLWGNKALGIYSHRLLSAFSFDDDSSKFKGTTWVVFFTNISTLLSTSLPFCKAIMVLTSLCYWCKLALTSCIPLGWALASLGTCLFQCPLPRFELKNKVDPLSFKVQNHLGLWIYTNSHLILQLVNGAILLF